MLRDSPLSTRVVHDLDRATSTVADRGSNRAVVLGTAIGEKIGVATAKRAVISRSILQGADAATDGRLLGEIDAKLGST